MMKHETLSIINKSKHPKKGKYKEKNGRTHVQEDKRTTYEGESQKGTSSSQTPSCHEKYCQKGLLNNPLEKVKQPYLIHFIIAPFHNLILSFAK
jgi:hypothetical protein